MRKRMLPLIGVLVVLALLLLPIQTVPQVEQAPNEKHEPNTAYIKHVVEQGKVIKLSANWTYKLYANGKLVKDPFAQTSYFHLSSFTIFKRPDVGYDEQGFVIGTLNGETVNYNCDLYNANGRSQATNYILDSQTGKLVSINTTVAFIAPCSGNVFVPQRASGSDWEGSASSNSYKYSLIITGVDFVQNTPYRIWFVDNGIHDFTVQSGPSIDSSSYLYLLRGFFKDSNDPSIKLYSSSNVEYSPQLVWSQQRINFVQAKMIIKMINDTQSPMYVKKIKVTFDGYTYGEIIFVDEIILNPADYIQLDITINA